jgi:hypothetical protein
VPPNLATVVRKTAEAFNPPDQAAELRAMAERGALEVNPLLAVVEGYLECNRQGSDYIIRCRKCSAGWMVAANPAHRDGQHVASILEHIGRHASIQSERVGRGRL